MAEVSAMSVSLSRSPSPRPPPHLKPPEFLPAIIIRSGPATNRLPLDLDPYANLSTSGASPLPPPQTIYNPLPRAATWAEWNINPVGHGPEKARGLPVFVKAQGDYDDLGRGIGDGSEVDVEQAGEGVRRREDGENGESVAAWYAALSRSASGTPRTGIGATVASSSQSKAESVEKVEVGAKAVVKVGKQDAIDLTADSDEDEGEQPSTNTPSSSGPPAQSAPPAQPAQILRVDPKEWYIRRALLKSHQSTQNTSIAPKQKVSTSIGGLLGVTPIQVKAPSPTYALGPDNKGYDILRNRLGWGGGGLGKPAGWSGGEGDRGGRDGGGNVIAGPSRGLGLAEQLDREDLEVGSRMPTATTSSNRLLSTPPHVSQHPVPDGVVDLTADSGSEAEADSELDDPSDAQPGPGRTAPIPTTLKLDRLGLGHKRGLVDRKGNSLKRVTHTHEQIEAAQVRAKRRVPVSQGAASGEMGKKGKVKWRERDRRDVAERRRIAAALNA